MKITVEINDADLHKAIGQQLDAAIARVVSEKIEAKVDEIMEVKFGRVDKGQFQTALQNAAIVTIRREFNDNEWQLSQAVRRYFSEAAINLIKDKVK